MLRLIRYAGPFATPLAILTILIAALILRASLRARSDPDDADGGATPRPAAILFWGFVAAILGFLAQCAALYRIMSTVVGAEALSPRDRGRGLRRQLRDDAVGRGSPAGGGVGVAAPARVGTTPRGRCRRPVAPPGRLLRLLVRRLAGTGRHRAGKVRAGSGGPDTFLFDLRGAAPDSLFGAVHVMRGGRMDSELGITRASYRPPELEMYIQSTNATYRGRVDLARGRITGGLSFGDQPGAPMELRWMDPAGLPGFAALAGDAPYAYRQPTDGADGWPTAAPEDVGLDRSAVEALVRAVAHDGAGLIHSLQIVRGGKLVLDEYFHGYTASDLHRLASATKSVASLLVGAAIDRGRIPGVDAPLLPLLGRSGDGAAPAWRKETLGDLLTMSMGLDWSAEEARSVHGTGPAFFEKVLAREVVTAPGTKWDYVSANVNLLAGVIFNATGVHADAFAREILFGPLGIATSDWSTARSAATTSWTGACSSGRATSPRSGPWWRRAGAGTARR